ncbi:MAG: EF-hand domain-containing protein [Magnetococcales bacterium]|nr:EF-hand domain-containing protein [Magnetococcales bacterium]
MNIKRFFGTFGTLALILPVPGMLQSAPVDPNPVAWACPRNCDINRDKTVTRDEVITMRTQRFTMADRNGDGYLTIDERFAFPRFGRGMGHGRMWAIMDRDGDGRLSKTEFVDFVPPPLAATMGQGNEATVAFGDPGMRPGCRQPFGMR